MSEDEYTLEDYIEYHRQPGSKMVAISEFNELMGSNIEENPEVEQVLYKLRQQFGPNEMIPPLAAKNRGKLKRAAKKARGKCVPIMQKDIAKELKKRCGNEKGKYCAKKLKKQNDGAKESLNSDPCYVAENKQIIAHLKDEEKRATKELGKFGKAKRAGKNYLGNKLGKITGSYNEAKAAQAQERLNVEQAQLESAEKKRDLEVEKVKKNWEKGKSSLGTKRTSIKKIRKKIEKDCKRLDKVGQSHPVCDAIKTSKSKTFSAMSTSLEDELIEDEYEETCDKCGEVADLCDHEFEDQLEEVSIEDAQTLQHLVAFKSKCSNVRERLMKGKGRYIEQLKAYMNGDNSAEIRMFTGKKVKVSSLNPKKESLKSLFESFPNGPHIVECD